MWFLRCYPPVYTGSGVVLTGLKLTMWVEFSSKQAPGSTYFHLLSPSYKCMPTTLHFLMRVLGTKLRSSCLHSKHLLPELCPQPYKSLSIHIITLELRTVL